VHHKNRAHAWMMMMVTLFKVTKNRLHELLIIKITIRGRTITVIIVIIISKGELHGIQKGPKSCRLFCVAKSFKKLS